MSRRYAVALVCCLLAMLVLSGVARATHKPSVVQRARFQQRLLWHYQYVAHYGKGRPRWFARKAIVWTRRELSETRRLIAHRQQAVPWPWTAIARCESGGDWAYNGRSGFDGGVQFAPSTWSVYRRQFFPSYPAFAWMATPHQQVAVAKKVLAEQGWAAWPVCSRRAGLR